MPAESESTPPMLPTLSVMPTSAQSSVAGPPPSPRPAVPVVICSVPERDRGVWVLFPDWCVGDRIGWSPRGLELQQLDIILWNQPSLAIQGPFQPAGFPRGLNILKNGSYFK